MSVYKRPRKDGKVTWCYYFCYKGKRHRGPGGTTRTQALRTEEKVRAQVINDYYELGQEIVDIEISKFAETFLERRQYLKSHERDALSVRTLVRFFKGKTLGKITASDIEDYIASRKLTVENGTINRELAALKRMYNLAIRWKQAKTNPVNDVDFLKEPPGRTRFLTSDEANDLLDCCSASLYPIVFTALNTGMRRMEILALTWDRVHIDAVISPFIELVETMNNKRRAVPLNDEMVELLEGLKGKDKQFVFIGERGKPLKSVRKPFETALIKSGIVDFRFHDLRHTFASHFVMQGGDPLTLKEILGHSSMKMVERYAHLAQAHKLKQVQNLDGLFKTRHANATCHNVIKFAGEKTGTSG